MTLLVAGISGILFLYGVRQFFPSGAALHCDRSALTVSRIPWFNLRGKWTSQSYFISDIAQFRFAVTRRGASFYGFRFRAAGQKQKLFVGLEAPEADEILKGLEHLVVAVIRDPKMPARIDETLRKRAPLP